MEFPIVIQHRHIHLSKKDAEVLFGNDGELTPSRPIGHRGQFLSAQTVDLVGENGFFEGVRVLGPFREETQVELSAADAFAIGIDAPVRISGDLARSGVCSIKGSCGMIQAKSHTIIPARHLHCNDQVARKLGLNHHETVTVELVEDLTQRIEHVVVRVHPTFANELHISSDEAARLWLLSHHRIRVCPNISS